MIAKPYKCDGTQLRRLLDASLPASQQDALTEHLDHCTHCQSQLELLTADEQWWQETQFSLSAVADTQAAGYRVSPQAAKTSPASTSSSISVAGSEPNLSSTEHWVTSLLEPIEFSEGEPTDCSASDTEPPALGFIDGMPVRSVIGQGGMGVVLLARDDHLHRDLAIKLLSPMMATQGAARQRFLREAQAAAAIVHPNIVPIYAVAAERKLPYLVMPFVAGGNLQQVLDDHGPLPLDRVLSIGLQVAEGLSAAHRQGIVHRDIKPANLMLDEGGFRIMLTDFGLARALDDATLTASGMIAGTPQYMSPEQALGRSLDHRSDIYSLGAVLYALATGRPPLRGGSTLELLSRIKDESPKPVTEINELLPAWFDELLRALMHKQVEHRVQSSDDAIRLLRESLAHARAPGSAPLPAVLQRPQRAKRVRQTIVVAALVVLAGTIGWLCATTGPFRRAASPRAESSAATSAPATSPADAVDQSQPSVAPEEFMAERFGSQSFPNSGDASTPPWIDSELDRTLDRLEADLRSLSQPAEF